LERIGAIAAASARQLEADLCVDLLATGSGLGPTLADGKRLFHTGHGNLKSPGAAPDAAGELAAAVKAMRMQTGISGRLIDVQPSVVLVPAALEEGTMKYFADYSPSEASSVNPYRNLRVVIDPRLDAKSASRWYVISEAIEGLACAYLEGNASPVVETRAGFEIDGIRLKVRHDFGCAFLDWRGWFNDAGA
jgi:hypothetical protein